MKTKKHNSGFTLIEIMVVIIIIGILVAIAIPNFIASQERAKDAHLKANMHLVQEAVELYGVDSGGKYTTIDALTSQTYWKELKNPFTLKEGSGFAYYNGNLSSIADLKDSDNFGGFTGLEYVNNQNKYYIYASDQKGVGYLKNKGLDFYLTNS